MISFPLTQPRFEYQFGVRAMPAGAIPFRQTESFDDEIQLKRRTLQEATDEVFACQRGSDAACQETADWMRAIVPGVSSPGEPFFCEPFFGEPFFGERDGVGLASEQAFLHVAMRVQEDIAILQNDAAAGFPVVAGLVCFPSGWSIRDKLGLSMGQTHDDVPEFAQRMLDRTVKLFASLKPGKTVERENWMIAPSAELSMRPSQAAINDALRREITADNAGQRAHFRVEQQTLTKLPTTGAIVFTILTTRCPLRELNAAQSVILKGVLETMPRPVADYKRITPMMTALQTYLDQRIGA